MPGFPSIDHASPRVYECLDRSRSAAPPAKKTAKVPSQLGKRGPIQPLPNGTGKRPSPLDALGDSALRSRDHFGHLTASVKAHLSPKLLRQTGIEDALLELQSTVARDMKEQRDETWRRGVTHGEWLKEGEGRLNSESAAAAEGLRKKVFELELQQVEAQRKYDLARRRISELSVQSADDRYVTDPFPPGAWSPGRGPRDSPPGIDPFSTFVPGHNAYGEQIDISDLLDSLADDDGTFSPISQPPLSPPDSYGTLSPS